MAKQGRKTLLTPEMSKIIVDGFLMGNYATVVADYAGITSTTLWSWLGKGKDYAESENELTDEEQMFADLFIAVKKAKAISEMKSVEVIRSASQTQWQAAAWYLERTANDRWGRVTRTEITGADGGAIEINAEALNRKLEALMDANMIALEQSIVDAQDVAIVEPIGTKELLAEITASDDTGTGLETMAEIDTKTGIDTGSSAIVTPTSNEPPTTSEDTTTVELPS